ncbi:MAG: small subunit ribosomal protein S8 [Acidimicrobiales bacterium]|jgi:small subunit ribosomal protein S8
MVGDTVGDFIIQLKNAGMVGNKEVSLPYSKLKHAIADKLVKEGYLVTAETKGEGVAKSLDMKLQYDANGSHRISGVKRVSKPGRRVYTKATEIYPVKFGKGKMILSTPVGILNGEDARKANVGGEQLFIIW